VNGGRLLKETPDLIRANHLFLGINFLSNFFVAGFESLTGFGARNSSLPQVCPVDCHSVFPEK
jgi:hypothetical protein